MLHDLKVPPVFRTKRGGPSHEAAAELPRRVPHDAWSAPASARREFPAAGSEKARSPPHGGARSPSREFRMSVQGPPTKRTGAGVTRPPGQRINRDRELAIKRKIAQEAVHSVALPSPDGRKEEKDAWLFAEENEGNGKEFFEPWDGGSDLGESRSHDFTRRTDLEVYGLDHTANGTEDAGTPLDLTTLYPTSTAFQKRYTVRGVVASKTVPPPTIETLRKRVQQKREMEAAAEREREHEDPAVADLVSKTDSHWNHLLQTLHDIDKCPDQRSPSQSTAVVLRAQLTDGEAERAASASASPPTRTSRAPAAVKTAPTSRRVSKTPSGAVTPRGRPVKAAPPTKSVDIDAVLARKEPTLTNSSKRPVATSPRGTRPSVGTPRSPGASASAPPPPRKPATVAGAARLLKLRTQHSELVALLACHRSKKDALGHDELLAQCESTLATIAQAVEELT